MKRAVLLMVLLAACDDEGAATGECVASHLAAAPVGDQYVAYLGSDLVPRVARVSGAEVVWSEGAAWPTRALVSTDQRVAHLAGTGRLRIWSAEGTLIHQRDLTGDGACDGCGGLAFVGGQLATLWRGEVLWVTADGEDAGTTALPTVASEWCACSLGALPTGDLLVSGAAPDDEAPTAQVFRIQRDGTVVWRWDAPDKHFGQVVGTSDGQVLVFGDQYVRGGRFDGWFQRLTASGQALDAVTLDDGDVGTVSFLADHASGALRIGYVSALVDSGDRALYLLSVSPDGVLASAAADADWQHLVPLVGGASLGGIHATLPVESARRAVGCAPLAVSDYPL